jgi:hypothetical protein
VRCCLGSPSVLAAHAKCILVHGEWAGRNAVVVAKSETWSETLGRLWLLRFTVHPTASMLSEARFFLVRTDRPRPKVNTAGE